MKRKFFYGTLVCAAIVTSFFYACKKQEEESPRLSPGGVANSSANRKLEGKRVFYSRNLGDTVFKMILTVIDENIKVERSIYETTRPDTVKQLLYIDEGIAIEGMTTMSDGTSKGDTLKVVVPDDKTYYYIYFDPNKECYKTVAGGGETYEAICISGCDQGLTDFMYDCFVFGDPSNAKECMTVLCDDCFFFSKWGTSSSTDKVFRHGGAIMVEGTSINVVR